MKSKKKSKFERNRTETNKHFFALFIPSMGNPINSIPHTHKMQLITHTPKRNQTFKQCLKPGKIQTVNKRTVATMAAIQHSEAATLTTATLTEDHVAIMP